MTPLDWAIGLGVVAMVVLVLAAVHLRRPVHRPRGAEIGPAPLFDDAVALRRSDSH